MTKFDNDFQSLELNLFSGNKCSEKHDQPKHA